MPYKEIALNCIATANQIRHAAEVVARRRDPLDSATPLSLQQRNHYHPKWSIARVRLFLVETRRCDHIEKMPVGKIGGYAGKGADYSAGNVNIQHTTSQSKPRVLVQTAS